MRQFMYSRSYGMQAAGERQPGQTNWQVAVTDHAEDQKHLDRDDSYPHASFHRTAIIGSSWDESLSLQRFSWSVNQKRCTWKTRGRSGQVANNEWSLDGLTQLLWRIYLKCDGEHYGCQNHNEYFHESQTANIKCQIITSLKVRNGISSLITRIENWGRLAEWLLRDGKARRRGTVQRTRKRS